MLDVHAPEHTPHTVRDFFLHIFTITIGLLIALGLEAMVEWRHHVHLGHEAEATLRSEVADNQKDLQVALAAVPGEQKNLLDLLAFLREQQKGHASDRKQVSLNFTIATPQDASWNTATATGTVNYMEYARVKRYAAAYALQKKVEQAQDAANTPGMALEGIMATGDPNHLSPEDLNYAILQIRLVIAQLEDARQLGVILNRSYADALHED